MEWRRRTGIEPAVDAGRRPLVLKTKRATRHPHASTRDDTGRHKIGNLVRAPLALPGCGGVAGAARMNRCELLGRDRVVLMPLWEEWPYVRL